MQDDKIDGIRKTLRGAFSELNNRGLAPMCWSNLTALGTDLMNSIMEKTHPIFRLANNGWKLHYLAMSSYPSWRRNNIENGVSENSKKCKHSRSSIKSEINEKKIKSMFHAYPINVTNCLAVDSSVSPIIADPELPAASALTSPTTGLSGLDPTEPVLELPGPLTSPAIESPGLDSMEPV